MVFNKLGTKKLSIIGGAALICMSLLSVACTGEDGKDGIAGANGKDGKDAKVNVDSLAEAIRDEVTGTLWDSLYAESYVDTVYNILFDNTYSDKWMDSVRSALIDSLKGADYDSLYSELYDNIYSDIYSQNIIKNLDANIYYLRTPVNGAFVNLYPTIYKGMTFEDGTEMSQPLSVFVRNTCVNGTKEAPCRWNKIMVKAWVPGFADTASVTQNLNPNTSIVMGPDMVFDQKALYELEEVADAQMEVRVYALENDREILFFSATESLQINPVNINGGELADLGSARNFLYAAWVTPAMDSISHIIKEVSKKLPNGTLKAYQKYSEDESVEESTSRVVKAVFDVLKTRGIKYIENDGGGAAGQKMEYPIEVLRTKRAVCNEFTFLFASVLEAIGFNTYLVLKPEHIFVGWATERNGSVLDFVETTMLDNEKNEFKDAVNSARTTYQEQVEAGNFESGDASLVSIDIAREAGITPNNVP